MLAEFPHLPPKDEDKMVVGFKEICWYHQITVLELQKWQSAFQEIALCSSGKLLANLRPAYGRLITNENISLLQDSQTIKTLRPLVILYFKILSDNILFTWPRNAL